MTREEAARVLEEVWKRYTSRVDEIESEEVDAVFMAIAALRGPEWVRTADRLPTINDARHDGTVLVANKNHHYGVRYWSYVEDEIETCPYWMSIPELPEVEG